jgi:hypothetical protein
MAVVEEGLEMGGGEELRRIDAELMPNRRGRRDGYGRCAGLQSWADYDLKEKEEGVRGGERGGETAALYKLKVVTKGEHQKKWLGGGGLCTPPAAPPIAKAKRRTSNFFDIRPPKFHVCFISMIPSYQIPSRRIVAL